MSRVSRSSTRSRWRSRVCRVHISRPCAMTRASWKRMRAVGSAVRQPSVPWLSMTAAADSAAPTAQGGDHEPRRLPALHVIQPVFEALCLPAPAIELHRHARALEVAEGELRLVDQPAHGLHADFSAEAERGVLWRVLHGGGDGHRRRGETGSQGGRGGHVRGLSLERVAKRHGDYSLWRCVALRSVARQATGAQPSSIASVMHHPGASSHVLRYPCAPLLRSRASSTSAITRFGIHELHAAMRYA